MAYRTVKLMGDGVSVEKVAGGTITPGHLLKRTSTDTVVVQSSAAVVAAQRLFALEDEGQGNGVSTNYTSGQRVKAAIFLPGDKVAALIKTGVSLSIGDKLEAFSDGTLQALTSGACIAVADEAVTGGASPVRAAVQIC